MHGCTVYWICIILPVVTTALPLFSPSSLQTCAPQCGRQPLPYLKPFGASRAQQKQQFRCCSILFVVLPSQIPSFSLQVPQLQWCCHAASTLLQGRRTCICLLTFLPGLQLSSSSSRSLSWRLSDHFWALFSPVHFSVRLLVKVLRNQSSTRHTQILDKH